MGIDGLSFGKDYAAEFKANQEQRLNETKEKLRAAGITVPVGNPEEKSTSKGIEVEKQHIEADFNRQLTTKEARQAKQKEYEEMFAEQGEKFEDENGNVHYLDKKAYKEAEKQRKADKKDAIAKYRQEGLSRKEAKEKANSEFPKNEYKSAKDRAKDLVKNDQNMENIKATVTFMDKSKYEEAEAKRSEQHEKLVAQYTKDGLSKKEAKAKADSQLPMNEYISKKGARKFVNEHKDMFFDENGFSSDKMRDNVVGFTNKNSADGEVSNGYLSLQERRKVAAEYDTKAKNIKNLTKAQNAGYEKDNTNLYRGLVIGATAVAAGATAIAGVGAEATAVAVADASAGAIAPGAIAGAEATAIAGAHAAVELTGAAIAAEGLGGAGLAALLRDKGNKEAQNFIPKKPEQHQPHPSVEPDVPVQPVNPNQPVQPTQPIQTPEQPVQPPVQPVDCPEQRWESETCDHQVGKGDNWSAVAQSKVLINGKKPDGKLLRAYVHAEKLKHGITNFGLNTMPNVYSQNRYEKLKNINPEKAEEYKQKATLRLYSDFADLLADEALVKKHPELNLLKDATITFNCDGKVDHRGNAGRPRKAYTKWFGAMTNPVGYKQDCHDNTPVIVK